MHGRYWSEKLSGISMSSLEDNIRMYLTEIGPDVVDWIHLFQDRDWWWVLVNTFTNLRVPNKAVNILTNSMNISFSRRNFFHGVSCMNILQIQVSYVTFTSRSIHKCFHTQLLIYGGIRTFETVSVFFPCDRLTT